MDSEYTIRLIHEYNPTLIGKTLSVPRFKRELYKDINRWMDRKQVIAIVGLRRTGKTTLMSQLMAEMETVCMYFSFDEEETQNKETLVFVIDYMINRLGSDHLFLDEIHYVHDWEGVIKRYYDQRGVKFILSGSESMNLSKAHESLAGRLVSLKLEPLSFREYLALRGDEIDMEGMLDRQGLEISNISLFDYNEMEELYTRFLPMKEVFEHEFREYLFKGAFPELVNEDDGDFIRKYIVDMVVKKVIYRDIPSIFQIKRRRLLYDLMVYACRYSASLFHIKNLANTFEANAETIGNYLFYLHSAFLIKTAQPYSGSYAKSVRRNKKIYVAAPSIGMAVLGYSRETIIEPIMGQYVESAFARDYFYRDKQKNEVDVILVDEDLTPIEIKYQRQIISSDLKGVLRFMDVYGSGKGIVITKELMEKRTVKGKDISLVPAWLALLVYQ